jgi:hypothetical protein
MNIVKGSLVITGIICLVSSILVGVILCFVIQTTTMEAKMIPVVPSEADAIHFDDKIECLGQAVSQAGPGTQVCLVITQAEATSKIVQILKEQDLSAKIKELYVNFREGKIFILAKVDVGMLVSLGVSGRIEIDEGFKPKVVIESVEIGGGATLPAGVREQVANMIPSKDALTEHIASLPVKLTEVTITNGQLTIRGIVESPQEVTKRLQEIQKPSKK